MQSHGKSHGLHLFLEVHVPAPDTAAWRLAGLSNKSRQNPIPDFPPLHDPLFPSTPFLSQSLSISQKSKHSSPPLVSAATGPSPGWMDPISSTEPKCNHTFPFPLLPPPLGPPLWHREQWLPHGIPSCHHLATPTRQLDFQPYHPSSLCPASLHVALSVPATPAFPRVQLALEQQRD